MKVITDSRTYLEQKCLEENIVGIRHPERTDKIFHIGVSARQDLPVFLPGKSLPEDLDCPEDYYPYAEQAFDELTDHLPLEVTYQGRVLIKLGTGSTDNYGAETNELTFDEGYCPLAIALLQHILDNAGANIYLYNEDCLNGVF
jgi:hypothetical protein